MSGCSMSAESGMPVVERCGRVTVMPAGPGEYQTARSGEKWMGSEPYYAWHA